MRDTLMAKGNSKNVSEKALLLTSINFFIQVMSVFKAPKNGSRSIATIQILKNNSGCREKPTRNQI
jgi:hypothetical protein